MRDGGDFAADISTARSRVWLAEAMRAAVYRSTGPAAEVLRIEEIADPGTGAGPGPGAAGRVRRQPDRLEVPLRRRAHAASADVPGPEPGRRRHHRRGRRRAWTRPGWASGSGSTWPRGRTRTGRPPSTPSCRRSAPWRCRTASPFDLGANLGVPAMTAHRCLFADGPVDGRTVLVAGGAGAVGHFAIELARAAGATVIATVSGPEKAALATAAGAHHVVNYRDRGPGGRDPRRGTGRRRPDRRGGARPPTSPSTSRSRRRTPRSSPTPPTRSSRRCRCAS